MFLVCLRARSALLMGPGKSRMCARQLSRFCFAAVHQILRLMEMLLATRTREQRGREGVRSTPLYSHNFPASMLCIRIGYIFKKIFFLRVSGKECFTSSNKQIE